jgi:nucleoside-diphosphate-sugar epimerase
MRVLITGITGFIGGELAHRLVKEGHEVFGLVRYVVGRELGYVREIKDLIKLVTCDITDYFSVRNTIKKANPDVVFHLAALSPVRLSFEHPFEFQTTNLIGTMNISESILDLYGPDRVRLIAASTAEVYGIKEDRPFTEELSLEPSSHYAVSKAAMDIYLRMMHQVYGFNVVILRNSNTFGRKYDNGFVTEYLITEMLAGKDIYVGAPDSVRDYMYVDDHVNSYLLAMKAPEAKGEVFNIAGGKGYTNREWTLKIAEVLGFPTEKIHFGQYPPGYPARPIKSDQPFLVLDSSKAKRVLGWTQTIPLEEGLRLTIAHWRSKLK